MAATDKRMAAAEANAMQAVTHLSEDERAELAVHMVALLNARDQLDHGYWHDSLSTITDLAPTFAATLDRAIRATRRIIERLGS